MADPSERPETVHEALRSLYDPDWGAVARLGIDPDMPVARLAEDLAIAARARACEFINREIADSGEYETIVRRVEQPRAVAHYYEDAAAIVEWLLNGDTP